VRVSESRGRPARERRAPAPLHYQVLAGLITGAVTGGIANRLWRESPALDWLVDNLAQPVGQVFLRLLFMVVVPLVFTSLVLGVTGLGDLSRLGRISRRTFGLFLLTTTAAGALGLLLVNAVRPGNAIDPAVRAGLMEQFAGQAGERVEAAAASDFGVQTFVNIVPRNPLDAAARGDMLGLVFFSVIFGVALARIGTERAQPLLAVISSIGGAVEVLIGLAMKLAPIGVAALIFSVTARFGFDLLASLGLYVATVLGGLALHQFGALTLVARALAGVRPMDLIRRARALLVTAFSTSSSNATLPTTIRTAREFGVSPEVAGFVLPLGATMNMNGTALFEGVTVLFLAQAFGVEMSLGTQATVLVLVVLTAVGASGVPSGSIPLLIVVLETVGVPGEGIALVLGVDRILDMARTVPNVTSDLVTSIVVDRWERADGPGFGTPDDRMADSRPSGARPGLRIPAVSADA
jgi:DAACS family dicarboxylate/amino acid:cation (Na+ or H+) symporter